MSSNDNTNLILGVGAIALLGVGAYFLLKPEEAKGEDVVPTGEGGGTKLGLNEGGGGGGLFPGFDLGSLFGGGAASAAPSGEGGGQIFDLGTVFGSRGPSGKTAAQDAADARNLGIVDGHREMDKLIADLKLKSPITSAGYVARYTVVPGPTFQERLKAKQVTEEGPRGPASYNEGFHKGAESAMRNAGYRSTLYQNEGASSSSKFPKVMIAYHPNGAVLAAPPGFEPVSEDFVEESAKNLPDALSNSPYLYTLALGALGLV